MIVTVCIHYLNLRFNLKLRLEANSIPGRPIKASLSSLSNSQLCPDTKSVSSKSHLVILNAI